MALSKYAQSWTAGHAQSWTELEVDKASQESTMKDIKIVHFQSMPKCLSFRYFINQIKTRTLTEAVEKIDL